MIAKSSLLIDVKPWDDETDMKEMEKHVRTIEMDGLLWGACKLFVWKSEVSDVTAYLCWLSLVLLFVWSVTHFMWASLFGKGLTVYPGEAWIYEKTVKLGIWQKYRDNYPYFSIKAYVASLRDNSNEYPDYMLLHKNIHCGYSLGQAILMSTHNNFRRTDKVGFWG